MSGVLGDLIRDLRQARGWSQGRLADELCRAAGRDAITRNVVSRWETGRIACPDSFWLRHLATVLEVPLQVLEQENVDRRNFLTSVAGASIAPVVAADLLHVGFAQALVGGAPEVDEWRARLDAYGRDYMSLGAAEIQKRLAADLLVLQRQVERKELWDVAAKLMTLFAKTYPGSDGVRAVQWYTTATEAADRSGNPNTQVWVRGRAAIALGYEGAALGVASALAEQALAISPDASLGRLNAVMGLAHVAALRGEHERALELLREGRRIFDQAGSSEQESDYAIPEWRMNVFTSLLLARLGEERGAVAAQDEAERLLPDTLPRFATHLELHRGLMLSRAGDKEEGASYARSALDRLPPEKHSLTLRMLLQEVEAA